MHAALGLPAPTRPTPVDLRAVLVDRAMRLGLDPAKITVSEFCTRCGPSPFFSHRAGHTGRQFAGLALRPGAGGVSAAAAGPGGEGSATHAGR